LKPENILMDFKNKGSIKVIDFGTAHCFNKD
jgi:serine/threonine protein kinase